MKWYKHESDTRYKPELKRLIRKHGIQGYGLYNLIMESIAHTLTDKDPVPDFKETAADIADEFSIDIRKVEEIVKDCIDQGLFVVDPINKRLISFMMANLLDEYTGKRKQVVKMIADMKSQLALIPVSGVYPECILPEENREDKKKKQDKKTDNNRFVIPTVEQIKEYCTERNNKIDADYFFNYYQSKGWMIGKNKMKDWQSAVRTWEKRENDFAVHEDKTDAAERKRKEMVARVLREAGIGTE